MERREKKVLVFPISLTMNFVKIILANFARVEDDFAPFRKANARKFTCQGDPAMGTFPGRSFFAQTVETLNGETLISKLIS